MNEDKPAAKRDPEEKKATWVVPEMHSMPMREALASLNLGTTDNAFYS